MAAAGLTGTDDNKHPPDILGKEKPMKFLQAAQARIQEARSSEEGFTLAEQIVAMLVTTSLFILISLAMTSTIMPMSQSSLAHDNNLDLKPAQKAATDIYKGVDSFTRDHPDTAPSKSLLVSQGYVNEPSNVVWALHTFGSPENPQRCVIAYLSDNTTDYSANNPAAFGSLYGPRSLWQNCNAQVPSSGATPNWTSE